MENNMENNEFQDLGNAVEALQTTNEFEADVYVSKLRAFGIPAFLSFPGESGAAKTLCGRSNLSIRIMVPETKLEEAKMILTKDDEYEFPDQDDVAPPEEPSFVPFLAKGFVYLVFIALFLALIAMLSTKL